MSANEIQSNDAGATGKIPGNDNGILRKINSTMLHFAVLLLFFLLFFIGRSRRRSLFLVVGKGGLNHFGIGGSGCCGLLNGSREGVVGGDDSSVHFYILVHIHSKYPFWFETVFLP